MATLFLDFLNGSDAADGTSFANRVKTTATGTTAARTAPGDTIRIMKSPDPTSLGQNVSFTNKSPTLTLTSAVTANISLCQAAWTASANVTTNTSSTRKEGTLSATFAVAGAFTTGLAAYEAIASTDFSSYQQISFWIHTDTDVAANALSISLCSDVAGATPVNTVTIDFAMLAARWVPICIDTGGALGAAIQSVALYVNTDLGAGTVNLRLDNILAVKSVASADSLNLCSLIGKNTGSEQWYPIRSINGTTVTLDLDAQSTTTTTPRGYSGTTESVTGHKRETIKLTPTTGNLNITNESGTSGSVITYSGGWDTTNMTSQTGETWIDGRTSTGTGWAINSTAFTAYEKIGIVRTNTGMSNNGADNTFTDMSYVGSAATGHADISGSTRTTFLGTIAINSGATGYNNSVGGAFVSIANMKSLSNNGTGIVFSATNLNKLTVTGTMTSNNNNSIGLDLRSRAQIGTLVLSDNGSSGLSISTLRGDVVINSMTCVSNTSRAISLGDCTNIYIYDYTTSGNSTTSIVVTTTEPFNLMIKDASIGEASRNSALTAGKNQRIQYQALGGVTTTHLSVVDIGTIQSDTGADRHTLSGIAWKLSPTSTVATQYYPLTLPIAKIAVSANNLLTVTAWCKRDNTGITGRFRLAGGRVAGIDSDVTATITEGAGVYEQLELQATPTEDGVVEIYYDAYGGTTFNAWIDDLDFNQA